MVQQQRPPMRVLKPRCILCLKLSIFVVLSGTKKAERRPLLPAERSGFLPPQEELRAPRTGPGHALQQLLLPPAFANSRVLSFSRRLTKSFSVEPRENNVWMGKGLSLASVVAFCRGSSRPVPRGRPFLQAAPYRVLLRSPGPVGAASPLPLGAERANAFPRHCHKDVRSSGSLEMKF